MNNHIDQSDRPPAAVAVVVFGPWMMAMLLALTSDLWVNIPRIVR